jgi:hypothetical protein
MLKKFQDLERDYQNTVSTLTVAEGRCKMMELAFEEIQDVVSKKSGTTLPVDDHFSIK